jgi:hypothetical protein
MVADSFLKGKVISTDNLSTVSTEWTGGDTYIQSKLITRDLGVFNSPDEFYHQYGTNLSGLKELLFRYHIRKEMNRKVSQIRTCAEVEP